MSGPLLKANWPVQPAEIPGLQAPKQLVSLDDLLQLAQHYAECCMRRSGKMAPTLFMIGVGGPMMFVQESWGNDAEKDNFAQTARLLSIAYAAPLS
jgi:hypothetical protein